jgi:hypothetical protein
MDSGWSAARKTSNPWVDLVPHFPPKIGTPHGTSWVHLLGFSFLRRSGIIRLERNGKTLSTTFTNLTRPSLESGHWLSTFFTVGQRQGWSGDICDVAGAALLQRKG